MGHFLPKGKNISLFMAVNEDMGVCGYDIKMSTSAAKYDEWLDTVLTNINKWREENGEPDLPILFVMDNASIHSGDVKARDDVKYLPVYSPFLNPIENCFSIVKSKVKEVMRTWREPNEANRVEAAAKQSDQDQSDLLRDAIRHGIKHLAAHPSYVKNAVKHVWKYIMPCNNGEDIDGPPARHFQALKTMLAERDTNPDPDPADHIDLSQLAGGEDDNMMEGCPLCGTAIAEFMRQCDVCDKYVFI